MKLWMIDPNSKQPSVSLSMMALAFVLLIGANIMLILGKSSSTGEFMELFVTTTILYFGRKTPFVFKGKYITGEQKNEDA